MIKRIIASAAVLAVSLLGVAQAPAAQAAPVAAVGGSGSTWTPTAAQLAGHTNKPKGVVARKGAPPEDPRGVHTALRTACSTPPCYFYVGGRHNNSNTGAYASITINNAFLDSEAPAGGGTHAMTEIVVQSTTTAATSNIVEVGVTQDLGVNGGSYHPYPFVSFWKTVSGVSTFQCYNGCGYVAYTGAGASTVQAGVTDLSASVGTAATIGVRYVSTGTTGWWFDWNGAPMGYIPTSVFAGSGGFTSGATAQWFGEVASNWNEPCSDMGDGRYGAAFTSPWAYASDPAYVASASFNGGTPTVSMSNYSDAPHGYDQTVASGRTFYFGGGGATSAGNYPGNVGSC